MRKTASNRKSEILQATLQLAFDVGPDRVTTGMIADQLGLTQPAIYKHFPRKKDIWAGVAEQLTNSIADNITHAKNSTIPPDARLRMLVLDHLRLMQQNPALPEIMVMRDSRGTKAALRKQMQSAIADFRTALVANVRTAVKEGVFRADIDTGDAATLVFGIIQSLAMRMLVTGNPAILLEDGERLVNLQLSGFSRMGENR